MKQQDASLAPLFLHFLNKNNIEIKDRAILHVECSSGLLSAELAKKAARIHAFSTDQEKIDNAKNKYSDVKNLLFNHYTERFSSPRLFHLAIMDFAVFNLYSLNTIRDKIRIFECINKQLARPDGELFISITTNGNKLHPSVTTAMEMAEYIQEVTPELTEEEITALIMPPYSSLEDVHTALEEAGFEIIKSEEQSVNLKITEKNLRASYKAIIMGSPIFQCIPKESQKDFCKNYMDTYISQLQTTDNDKLHEPIITTIIHAYKIRDIS
jgi:2-polyprenyl-3-methyl-5-hydroxy-6-metoxy-1,4-benzoquinol methylase